MTIQTRSQAQKQNTESTLDDNNSETNATVSVSAPISAPILRSVDPSAISKFIREREHYELEIESKQA